jgi:hypothetical protein
MTFEKNENLESILKNINTLLKPQELKLLENVGRPKYPNLYLVGGTRCGSTLFTQWASRLGCFSYPSNFLSRFYEAPFIGVLIYKMLTEPKFQYLDEFSDINSNQELNSSIGKTQGFKAPHEFWYFWRRFMTFPDVPFSEAEFENNFNFELFEKELALIQRGFDDRPFLFKAKIANWYLRILSEKVKDAIFIHLYRDLLPTSRSLLKARIKWKGSKDKWFSCKPREYDVIKDMDVYHQVVGQLYFLEKEILRQKKYLGSKYISFSYEYFCENPEEVYFLINNKIKENAADYEFKAYTSEDRFEISNPVSDEDQKLIQAIDYFNSKYGALDYGAKEERL